MDLSSGEWFEIVLCDVCPLELVDPFGWLVCPWMNVNVVPSFCSRNYCQSSMWRGFLHNFASPNVVDVVFACLLSHWMCVCAFCVVMPEIPAGTSKWDDWPGSEANSANFYFHSPNDDMSDPPTPPDCLLTWLELETGWMVNWKLLCCPHFCLPFQTVVAAPPPSAPLPVFSFVCLRFIWCGEILGPSHHCHPARPFKSPTIPRLGSRFAHTPRNCFLSLSLSRHLRSTPQ